MRFHDRYVRAWNRALDDGDTGRILCWFAPGFQRWIESGIHDLKPLSAGEVARQVDAIVTRFRGGLAVSARRSIGARGSDEVVVIHELSISTGTDALVRAVLMENWGRNANGWLLYHDVVKPGTQLVR